MSALTGWLVVIYALACALTGIGPSLHYVPEPGAAHASVIELEGATALGQALRSAHAISAHVCLAMVLLHLSAVLATRRERHEQPLRWVSGVAASGMLLLLAFGGRVLPWDQHAGVSLSIGLSMIPASFASWLGVGEPGVLGRLLAVHVLLTFGLLGVVAGHGYNRDTLRTIRNHPSMVGRVTAAALVPLAIVAAFVRAPLGPSFEPAASATTVTSDWYVRWVEVLAIRGGWVAQLGCAGVLAIAIGTPWWARRVGEARARVAWWVMLGTLGLMSLLPIR